MKHHNLPFDLIIGYHDVSQKKPSPEGMLKVLNYFQISVNQSISFGDQYTDIIASNLIGIQSVACLWGNTNNHNLLNSKPSFILNRSEDILTLIN